MTKKALAALMAVACLAPSAFAGIYTFADFTRAAAGASTTTTHDFSPNEGWGGTPPNTTSGVVYLKMTVSWSSTASNIGTFQARFNQNDDAVAARLAMGKTGGAGTGFEFITANTTTDPDGAGPATARPPIAAVNASTKTSVTLVMKVDHTKAGTNPGGDYWFAASGLQSGAVGFMWIDPNLSASEASQFTPWAAWRSGNASYSGVSFITDTDAVDLSFSNIALYTGGDTPFSTAAAIADAGTSTVAASPTAIPANGTSTSAVTVTLKDAGGSPVAGKQVSLSGNASAIVTTGDNISNANGVVTFTVKSGAAGTEVFTATVVTDGNLVITQTASVDFQQVVPVGPVSAANSTVSASLASVAANGVSTSTITVTLKDANGSPIVGEGVNLSGTPSGASISPSGSQATDANGRVVFTVSSSTIGTVTFSAASVTDNITVTATADVAFVDPATAAAYNVNFLDEGQAALTGQVGVAGNSGETWNQGTTSVSNLADASGAATSTVSVSGLGNDGRSIIGAALSVFGGVRNVLDKGTDTTISITGLTPNTPYDLYVYALSHNASSWGDIASTERGAGDFVTANTVSGNGQSQYLDNAKTGTNASAFVPNGNYVAFQSIVSDGSGKISVVADAYDGIDGNPATDDGDCRLHVNGLQIRPAGGMSVDYRAWRSARHPGLGMPGADDDGDGLTNDFERIFGLDPTNPASTSPILGSFNTATGSLAYSRRSPSLSNKTYKLWYSTNLSDWFVDNAAFQTIRFTANDIEIVDVTVDPALLGEPKLFMQVRAAEVTGIDPEPSLVNLWGSGNTITLLFSEPMNASSLGNLSNYTIQQTGGGNPGITGATISSDGGSVTLTLDSTLGLNTGYTVTMDGVTSGTGQAVQSGLSRQFKTWDNNPSGIKVFILAGQSNMVGYGSTEKGMGDLNGSIGSMRYLAVNDASFPDYNYASLLADPSQPAISAWKTRSDVKVWWRNGKTGFLGGAIQKGDLGPPFQGANNDLIGPEYAFGQIIGDFYTSEDVLIIKAAWGGRSLGGDFRPPSAVAKRGGRVGPFYSSIIDQTREVLGNIGTQFPEWSGRGYEIVGFAWHQGYNDRIDATLSAEYKDNLPDLIGDVRALFVKPNLPFVIATTGMGGVGPVEPVPYTGYTPVEKAQLWTAGVAKPANVLSSDTRGFWRDSSVSPANQGHHWNWSAESYFLVGKALGDNMVNLLSP